MIFSDRRIVASSRASRHASWKMTGLWVVKTWSRIESTNNPKTPEGATDRLAKPVFVVVGIYRNIGHLKPLAFLVRPEHQRHAYRKESIIRDPRRCRPPT
jgi:hypothetical protein